MTHKVQQSLCRPG